MSEGRKNDSEKVRLELISSKALIELGKVLTFGAKKYDANNWRKGLAWSRIIGAIQRHVAAYNDGETKDPETGLSHIAHAMCECSFLLEFEQTHPELDDRFFHKTETNCAHQNTIEKFNGLALVLECTSCGVQLSGFSISGRR